jgi:predicted O-linked N-acetylglucosamine transferase (SPINDLY family)
LRNRLMRWHRYCKPVGMNVAPPLISLRPDATTINIALVRLRAALDDFHLDASGAPAVRNVVRELAALVADWPLRDDAAPLITDVRPAARVLWASGLNDLPAPPEDLTLADRIAARGWHGLLAAMLLVPAWAWKGTPPLARVPDRLWGDYMHWLLEPPRAPAISGIVDAHFRRISGPLLELAMWMERNRGSAAVRAAAEAFLDLAGHQTPLLATIDLKDYAVARARLIRAIGRTRTGDVVLPGTPREGRALRIGVMARSFAAGPETVGLLPVLQRLDPERVELVLFAPAVGRTPSELEFRRTAAEFHVLPPSREERLALCGGAACDILLYASDLVGPADEFTGLALQRLAPLQGVLPNAAVTTTGFAEMDLRFCVAGTVEPSTERIALLPGWGFGAAADPRAGRETDGAPPLREEFGLPSTGPVFACAARPELHGAELHAAWTQLLAAVPDAALLLLLPEDADPFLTEELPARLARLGGFDPVRVVVVLGDTPRALALADVYLDSYPTADPVALSMALHTGLPAVVWGGRTHRARMGAALLMSSAEQDQVAADAAGYVEQARRLAVTPELRGHVRAAQQQAFAANPARSDALATADALTALLEIAFDAHLAGGINRCAPPLKPDEAVGGNDTLAAEVEAGLERGDIAAALAGTHVLLAGDPCGVEARRLHAMVLRRLGRSERALTYALAALAGNEHLPARWLDVADLLRDLNRTGEAIEAYEAALKLDAGNGAIWHAVADLADSAGHAEFAAEARATAAVLTAGETPPASVTG